ncbi:hypothetical protein TSUD_273150 [Trifolium subterraneum]|uniref:Uncharacterized protein n=1 Tax=Trifolium subterraneum TaxID=3900 RepID=A0A2Z6M533_TRISU|nr:hypothetical protein TSUD_273150 [Trifolium subterraneum]
MDARVLVASGFYIPARGVAGCVGRTLTLLGCGYQWRQTVLTTSCIVIVTSTGTFPVRVMEEVECFKEVTGRYRDEDSCADDGSEVSAAKSYGAQSYEVFSDAGNFEVGKYGSPRGLQQDEVTSLLRLVDLEERAKSPLFVSRDLACQQLLHVSNNFSTLDGFDRRRREVSVSGQFIRCNRTQPGFLKSSKPIMWY